MLKGKKLSILGDSVSTYRRVSDDHRANYSLIYNPYFYREPMPLEKTYWMRVIEHFGMTLCVNNSWAGGNLSGRDDPHSGLNRAEVLSRDDGTDPDIVILFMGLNDLGRRVDVSVFSADYEYTLAAIRKKYPNVTVCCINLPDREAVMKKQTEAFNAAIDAAVKAAGKDCFVADLFHSRLNNDCYHMNTLDGLHPDEDGMRIIADVVTEAMKSHFGNE